MRNLTDGRGRSPIDYFDVARLQFDGRAIAFHAAAVDGLAPAFEKVRQAVAETRRNAGDDRKQPRTITFNEVRLVLDAFDGTRDHWSFLLYKIFSADCHISKTMHTCASPFVGVMAELSKPMTAMLHPLLSCTFKFSEIFDGCVPSSLASHVCKPAPPVKLVQLVKMVSAESAMRPMSIFHYWRIRTPPA